MTKIQITQEQEKELLERLTHHSKEEFLDMFVENAPFWFGTESTLLKIKASHMAKMLYVPNSYEVINPITVGSYVRSKMTGSIYKVKAFVNGGKQAELEGIICAFGYVFADRIFINQLELLTEEEMQEAKEKHFWKKLDREVGELREGDVIYTQMNNSYRVVHDEGDKNRTTVSMKDAKRWLTKEWIQNGGPRIVGIYPVEKMVGMKDLWK